LFWSFRRGRRISSREIIGASSFSPPFIFSSTFLRIERKRSGKQGEVE